MKLKNLWLPTVIFTLVGGLAKICDTIFNVHGDGFFLSSAVCNWIFAGSFIILLILGYIFSALDSKKDFHAVPVKNKVTGVFGFTASVMIIAGGVLSILKIGESEAIIFDILNCIIMIAGGGILLFESCISFTGQNGMKKAPALSLLVPMYVCLRFVGIFSGYTAKSILATEMFDIVAAAFLLLFTLYQAMFFSDVNNTIAVRKASVYGSAFIMCGLVVAIDMLIKMTYPSVVTNIDTEIIEPTLTNIITCLGDMALCGYAVYFIKDIQKSAEETLTDTPDETEETAKPLITDEPEKEEAEPLLSDDSDDTEISQDSTNIETAAIIEEGEDTAADQPSEIPEEKPLQSAGTEDEPSFSDTTGFKVKPVVAMPADEEEN